MIGSVVTFVITGDTSLAREAGDPAHFDATGEPVKRIDRTLSDRPYLTRGAIAVEERPTIDPEAVPQLTILSNSHKRFTVGEERTCGGLGGVELDS